MTYCNAGTDVAYINPFLYRGYYYDSESGLYYLMSRYYDPEIGQCVSQDLMGYISPEIIGGVNLYSYCFNNPIMLIDDCGYWPKPFMVRGWKISFHAPRAGKNQQYHVHVDGYGKNYAQNIDGSTHDGLTGVPDKIVRDAISKATHGKWEWKINEMLFSNEPYWQEGFTVEKLPSYQEGFSVESLPPYQEGFSVESLPPYQEQLSINKGPFEQEGFSMPEVDKNTVIAIVVIGGAIITLCVIGAFFTAGQSL